MKEYIKLVGGGTGLMVLFWAISYLLISFSTWEIVKPSQDLLMAARGLTGFMFFIMNGIYFIQKYD